MKKFFITSFILISLGLDLGSCSNAPAQRNTQNSQISLVAESTFHGVVYQIVDINGIQYVSTNHGGICPLQRSLKD